MVKTRIQDQIEVLLVVLVVLKVRSPTVYYKKHYSMKICKLGKYILTVYNLILFLPD